MEVKRYMSTIKMIENLNRDNASIQEINEKISIFNMKLSNITFKELLNSNAKRVKIDDEAPIDVYILNNVKFVHFNSQIS